MSIEWKVNRIFKLEKKRILTYSINNSSITIINGWVENLKRNEFPPKMPLLYTGEGGGHSPYIAVCTGSNDRDFNI